MILSTIFDYGDCLALGGLIGYLGFHFYRVWHDFRSIDYAQKD